MVPDPPPGLAARALRGRRHAHAWADRILTGDQLVFERATGVATTQVLGTFAELSLAEAIAARGRRGATAADLAPEVRADADALHRLLRTADAAGLVRMHPRTGRCRLTRLGRALRADHPRSQRDWCIYMASPATTAAWAGLTDAVRTGESAFATVHGRSVWDHFAAHPDEEAVFAGAMRRLTETYAPALAAAYAWPAGATVCDVGGGVGTLLAAVLDHEPTLDGVLLDGPGVLAGAARHLRARGHHDRVQLLAGNMFEGPGARADVYLLKDVLHDWDDGRSAQILRVVRDAAPDGARVVLFETTQEWGVPHPFAAFEDLQMLTQCDGGRQRSVAQLQTLLADAGFAPGMVRETLSHTLVEGVAVVQPPR